MVQARRTGCSDQLLVHNERSSTDWWRSTGICFLLDQAQEPPFRFRHCQPQIVFTFLWGNYVLINSPDNSVYAMYTLARFENLVFRLSIDVNRQPMRARCYSEADQKVFSITNEHTRKTMRSFYRRIIRQLRLNSILTLRIHVHLEGAQWRKACEYLDYHFWTDLERTTTVTCPNALNLKYVFVIRPGRKSKLQRALCDQNIVPRWLKADEYMVEESTGGLDNVFLDLGRANA
jgi:hypothetical protein